MFNIHFIGDIEGHLNKLIEVDKTTHADIIIQTGDLGLFKYRSKLQNNPKYKAGSAEHKKALTYWHQLKKEKFPKFNHPVYTIPGTNDDFRMRKEDREWAKRYNLHLLPRACVRTFYNGNVKIAFLGGIFSSKRYGLRYKSNGTREDRFFRGGDIKLLAKENDVDVMVTHHAMTDILPHREEGSEIIHTLFDCLKPSLYIHGNHHKSYLANYNGTAIIGLGNYSKDEKAQRIKQFT